MPYCAEVHFPRHSASIAAIQGFFAALCSSLSIPKRTQLDVELALEEGILNFFKHALAEGTKELVQLRFEFREDAIRLIARAPGRPFDFTKLPRFNPLQSVDEEVVGLGLFLIQHAMDSVQWRYVEKQGQEFEMLKRLPAPIDASGQTISAGAERVELARPIDYRVLDNQQDALALSAAAWHLYRYAYKDILYYPKEVVERVESGRLLSWIAVDQAGTVVGHYAMMRASADSPLGEMGAAFVRPEVRKDGVFRQLSEQLHAAAFNSGVRGLFSLSITNHVATQKISQQAGRLTVGIRLASTPSIFVEGEPPGQRVATVLNYRQLVPRPAREVFLPERHREMVLASYEWLGIPVTPGLPATRLANTDDDRVECHRDFTWNRAQIEARGGEAARHKLKAFTDVLIDQGVACILLSIDLEDPHAPMLAEAAEALGYVYSGLFPESCDNGHDALQLQLINGITIDPEAVTLYQPSALVIMDYLQQHYPALFARRPA
jgi:serine/threonine-protein kinase RsbW